MPILIDTVVTYLHYAHLAGQELLHFRCSFDLYLSPDLPTTQPQPQGWLLAPISTPELDLAFPIPRLCAGPAPGDATSVLPPRAAPGAAEAVLKILGYCSQVRGTGFFPASPLTSAEGSPSSPPRHGPVFLCPIFWKSWGPITHAQGQQEGSHSQGALLLNHSNMARQC